MSNFDFSKPVKWWMQATIGANEKPMIQHLVGTIATEHYSPFRQYLLAVKPKAAMLEQVIDLAQIVSWRRGMTFIDEVSVLTAIAALCDNAEALKEHITKVMETSVPKTKSQMMEDMCDPSYRIDPCIGREREIQELVTALLKRKKSNAVLVGQAGVGKTSIVEGFVQLIRDKKIPEFIGYRVLIIDMAVIFSGTSALGALQEKIKRVLSELRKPRTIGFVDEVHSIFASGNNNMKKDVGDMFKPALANGDIKIIGATTDEEYKDMEKDGAIKRRFQKIKVAEPDIETTFSILKGVRSVYAKHHGVSIPDSVLYKAAEMAARYMHYDKNPDSAIDLIDNTAARVRSSRTGSIMDRLTDVSTSRIVIDNLIETIYLRTGIDVKDLVKTDFKRMQTLETDITKRVLGQDEAVKVVATAVRAFKIGLRNKKKPFVFMFAGTTGVGKCVDGSSVIWQDGCMKRMRSLSSVIPQPGKTVPLKTKVLSITQDGLTELADETSDFYKDATTQGWKITTKYGYNQKTSPWHPVFCYDRASNSFGYLKADKIANERNIEDIWIPIRVGHPYWNTKKNVLVNNGKRDIEITKDTAYAIGFLIGDGSLGKIDSNPHIRFSTGDAEIPELLTKAAKAIDKQSSVTHYKGCDWGLSCPDLGLLLRRLDLSKTAEFKEIPDVFLESPKTVTAALLSGLFDSDGSALKNGYLEYCSKSQRLVEDMQTILLAFGIVSSVREKIVHYRYKETVEDRKYYVLNIRGDAARQFYKEIGFRLSRKQARQKMLPKDSNPNWTVYPIDATSRLMQEAVLSRKDRGVKDPKPRYQTKAKNNSGRDMSLRWAPYAREARITPSIEKMGEFIKMMKIPKDHPLQVLYRDGNVIWLPVQNMEKTTVDLYDLVVPKTHSFISNGFHNHNTELTKQLNRCIFGDDKSLIRFDMNEFAEPHAVSRLGGSPPGYIGSEEGGQLTEKVKRQPYSIVLLDEWEKAHKVVHQRFLNIFDDGRSDDAKGIEIDFSNCIFILTTNMGVKEAIDRKTAVGFNRKPMDESLDSSIKETIKERMPPELRNRIDEVIIFKSEFSEENLMKMAKIHVEEAFTRSANFKIEYTDKVLELVVKRYEKIYGGRSIRRFVDSQLMPPIVDYIVFNEKKHVKVDVKDPASTEAVANILEVTDGEVKGKA